MEKRCEGRGAGTKDFNGKELALFHLDVFVRLDGGHALVVTPSSLASTRSTWVVAVRFDKQEEKRKRRGREDGERNKRYLAVTF